MLRQLDYEIIYDRHLLVEFFKIYSKHCLYIEQA
jgi:hypothetical protein